MRVVEQSENLQDLQSLWEQYQPLVKKWARMTHLEGWDREDLEQEAYLILQETMDKYDGRMPFGGFYKMRLIIWRGRQLRRKKTLSSNVESIEREMLTHPEEGIDLAQQVENQLVLETLVQAMEKLEEQETRLLKAYYLEGKKLEVIAQCMGLTISGVKSKKRRALFKLKDLLGERLDTRLYEYP